MRTICNNSKPFANFAYIQLVPMLRGAAVICLWVNNLGLRMHQECDRRERKRCLSRLMAIQPSFAACGSGPPSHPMCDSVRSPSDFGWSNQRFSSSASTKYISHLKGGFRMSWGGVTRVPSCRAHVCSPVVPLRHGYGPLRLVPRCSMQPRPGVSNYL
jgi:hypothetical protein